MKRRIKWVVIIFIGIIALTMAFIGVTIVPYFIIKNDFTGDGKYHIVMKYHLSESLGNYIPLIEKMGIDVDNIVLDLQKDGDLYYGNLYINDNDKAILEFFQRKSTIMFNIRTILSYVAEETDGYLPDTIMNMIDMDNDLYITGEAIQELVGMESKPVERTLSDYVTITGVPKFCMVHKNVYKGKNAVGVEIELNDSIVIHTAASTNIISDNSEVFGTRIYQGESDDFYISCKKDKGIQLEMPKSKISKLDVVIMKKVAGMLIDYLKERQSG